MRTLALFPLLLAISPSRIWIRRITELFQSSFASKNLRSISSGMSFFRFLVDPSFVALSSRSARPLVVFSETSKRDQPDDQNVFYHDTSPLV